MTFLADLLRVGVLASGAITAAIALVVVIAYAKVYVEVRRSTTELARLLSEQPTR